MLYANDINKTNAPYKEKGIVVRKIVEAGRKYYIYADASGMNEEMQDIKNKIKKGALYEEYKQRIDELFKENALCIPDNINPIKPTKQWWEWITGDPEDILRERGKKYLIPQ